MRQKFTRASKLGHPAVTRRNAQIVENRRSHPAACFRDGFGFEVGEQHLDGSGAAGLGKIRQVFPLPYMEGERRLDDGTYQSTNREWQPLVQTRAARAMNRSAQADPIRVAV